MTRVQESTARRVGYSGNGGRRRSCVRWIALWCRMRRPGVVHAGDYGYADSATEAESGTGEKECQIEIRATRNRPSPGSRNPTKPRNRPHRAGPRRRPRRPNSNHPPFRCRPRRFTTRLSCFPRAPTTSDRSMTNRPAKIRSPAQRHADASFRAVDREITFED